MWAIPTGTNSALKKNQVKSPSICSRTLNSVRILQSGRARNRGVTIMHRMDKQEIKMHTAHEIGAVERELMRRSDDVPTEEDSYGAEEVKYVNEPINYHFKPNPNLPTHYNPALRNHENFSYGGGALHGPRHGQHPQQGYQQPPRF